MLATSLDCVTPASRGHRSLRQKRSHTSTPTPIATLSPGRAARPKSEWLRAQTVRIYELTVTTPPPTTLMNSPTAKAPTTAQDSSIGADWLTDQTDQSPRGGSTKRVWPTVLPMSDHESAPTSSRDEPLTHPDQLLSEREHEELYEDLERMARSRRNVRAASATLRFG